MKIDDEYMIKLIMSYMNKIQIFQSLGVLNIFLVIVYAIYFDSDIYSCNLIKYEVIFIVIISIIKIRSVHKLPRVNVLTMRNVYLQCY